MINKKNELKKKKQQAKLKRVVLAKEEMEIKILEREEDIERIKENIQIQENAILEIENEIKGK